ncbi:MAG: hypothetical protein HYX68_10160 [Planctomycetes bacterium]|nr:hypothetical protein [Planctomycetota bacterium]
MDINDLIKDHSGELVMLAIGCVLMGTLLIALPQLLRANLRKHELAHAERMKSLENGLPLPAEDNRGRMAGRIALLVPMASIISAATVTSFLSVYKTENLFAVSLAIWIVAGAVSLAAITGGVALISRLDPILDEEKNEDQEDPAESSYMK